MSYKIWFVLMLLGVVLVVWLLLHEELIETPLDNEEPPSLMEANRGTGADVGVERVAADTQIEVYDGIFVSENAIILDLSGRELSGSLKAEIRQLQSLELLDISRNNFTGLPAEVGHLKKLRVLNLSYNPLTGLPHELGNLSKLEEFDLRGTRYSENDLTIIRGQLPESTRIFIE